MAQSMKRSYFSNNNVDANHHGTGPLNTFGNEPKRMCLGVNKTFMSSCGTPLICFSSSDDNDLEDESCYRADQVKAKRRASTRVSFSVNPSVCRAIAKYSDEDDEHYKDDGSEILKVDDNIDCKILSKPSSSINLDKLRRRSLSSSSFQLSDDISANNSTIVVNTPQHISNSFMNDVSVSSPQSRKIASCSDKSSRNRCFEYLVGAIDEAWARYCDATSYDYEDGENQAQYHNVATPASVATDEEDFFGNSTDITDYEDSDYSYNHSQKNHGRSVSITGKPQMFNPVSSPVSSSVDQSSSQLQALKDRLTKAKYYLQDLVDSDDSNEVSSFWKRWDMIKYATIELVEDDDDDEVVENTIEELEDGRLYVN